MKLSGQSYRLRLKVIVFIMATLVLFTHFIPSANAAPVMPAASDALPVSDAPGDPSDTRDVWLDIEASVPDDFRGDVTVVLENTDSHEYYTIEAHYVGGYKNSIFVPTGHYVVDNLYTSVDINAYGITMAESEFAITDSITLRPEVFKYGGSMEGMTPEEIEQMLQQGPGTIPDDPADVGYQGTEPPTEPVETPFPEPTEQPSAEPSEQPSKTPEPEPGTEADNPAEEEDTSGGLLSAIITAITVIVVLVAVGLLLNAFVKKHNSLD